MIVKWLWDDGMPYRTMSAPAFLQMVSVGTGDSSFTLPARDTFNSAVNARYKLLTQAVSRLLAGQSESVCGLKFLTLIHDAWTCNKKTRIIGTLIAFIDQTWTFQHIVLPVAIKIDGHSVGSV